MPELLLKRLYKRWFSGSLTSNHNINTEVFADLSVADASLFVDSTGGLC